MVDTNRTPHEQWAETEAEFCDKMVEEYIRIAGEWHAKGIPMNLHGEDITKMVLVCQVKGQTWADMANNLRRPYRIRLEREQHESGNNG